MNSILRKILVLAVITSLLTTTNAQDKGAGFNVQGDIVSSYIWRGMYQSGAAVQPTLGMNIKGFSLTAWGSVDFNGEGKKEADITAAYSFKGVTVSLTDYWWAGQNAMGGEPHNKYFMFDNHRTNHILEAGLAYTLPCEKFPLSMAWYTMIWGADKKISDKGEIENAYSSYCEFNYPFSIKNINLNVTLGMSPFESQANYLNKNFAVTNIALKATKDIKFTDSFSLPVYTQVIWNPNMEDVHFVFGITLK